MIEFCLILLVFAAFIATSAIVQAAEAITRWTSFDIQQTIDYERQMNCNSNDDEDDGIADCQCGECNSDYEVASRRLIDPNTGRCPHGFQDTDLCPDCRH